MFRLNRITSLILAFCLGFSVCAGSITFIGLSVISKFRIRDIEKHGINIPDEAFMTGEGEVDLLNLSIVEFIDEIKKVSSLGEQLTIELIQNRYGLILHDKLDAALTDETRKMPLNQLLSKDGIANMLSSVYIGNVENYTCYKADGTVGGDPKDETTYWMTASGNKITGIEDIIADFSLGDFLSGNINTDTLFDEVTIGDIFGYKKDGDHWIDKEGNTVTGVIAAFAGSTIHSIGSDINDLMIGDILGYEKNDKDEWCKRDESTGELVKVTGVMAVFAGSKINEIGDEIEGAKIGDLLGYEFVDGSWHKRNEADELEKITGVMAVFADSDINGIGKKIEQSTLGELLGYKLVDNVWYKPKENSDELEEVTGVMAVFADCNIDGIGTKLEEAKLGEILGYELVDNVWYKRNADTDELEKVTGAMAVFANSNINGVGDQIEQTKVGKLLGYELINDVWYQPEDVLDENGDRVPVDGFMSKISNSTINNMDGVFETLYIGDIVKDRTGIFSIIKPDTKINDIGTSVNASIKDTPLQFFINQGLITFDDTMCNQLDGFSKNDLLKIYPTDDDFATQEGYYKNVWTKVSDSTGTYYTVPNWRTQKLSESFSYIINLVKNPFNSIEE